MDNIDYLWTTLEVEAQQTNCKKRQVACIIYDTKKQEIVSFGHNHHPDGVCDCKTTRTALHAEQMAVKSLQEKRAKEHLIAFINHSPCNNCAKVLDTVVSEVRYKSQI